MKDGQTPRAELLKLQRRIMSFNHSHLTAPTLPFLVRISPLAASVVLMTRYLLSLTFACRSGMTLPCPPKGTSSASRGRPSKKLCEILTTSNFFQPTQVCLGEK